jgi:hypothetical protein
MALKTASSTIMPPLPFFSVVVVIAIVMWILTMGLYAILIVRTQPVNTKRVGPCPDKWTLTDDNKCQCNDARDNTGKYDDDVLDIKGCDWFCKKEWATRYGVLWDGLFIPDPSLT